MAENAGGFMGGLAEGIQQGTNMGYLAQQARSMQMNQQRQMMLLEAQQAREEKKAKMAEAKDMLDFYNKLPPKSRESWKGAVTTALNDGFGTNLRPDQLNSQMEDVISYANPILDKVSKGEMSYEDAIKKITPLYIKASAENQPQLKDTISFLQEGAKREIDRNKKDPSNNPSMAFQGFGPNGNPIFTSNKSTQFFGPDGNPVPINATGFTPKTDVPKIQEKIRGLDQTASLIDRMDADLASLASGPKGLAERTASGITLGLAFPGQKRFEDQRKAVAVKLYRDMTGDTRLSDADAMNRALPYIPSASEARSVQKQKIAAMKETIKFQADQARGKLGDPNKLSPMAKTIFNSFGSLSQNPGISPDAQAVIDELTRGGN